MARRLTYNPPAPPNRYWDDNQDAWYNLGNLAGMIWGHNYTQRGVDKATLAGQQALADYQNPPQAPVLNEPTYQPTGDAITSGTIVPQADNTMSGLVANSVDNLNNPLNTTLTGNTLDVANGITSQDFMRPAQNIAGFRGDDFKTKFYAQQSALGRPKGQIDMAWESIAPQVQGMDKQAKTERSNAMLLQLAGNGGLDFNNPTSLQDFNQLQQDNPEMAKIILSNAIADRNYQQKVQLANVTKNNTIETLGEKARLAKVYGNKGSNGKTTNGLTMKDLKERSEYFKGRADDETLSDDERAVAKRAYDSITKEIYGLNGIDVGTQGTQSAPLDDFVSKYSGMRKDDLYNLNANLAKDTELINYLKSHPNEVEVFEQRTGIRLPRKK